MSFRAISGGVVHRVPVDLRRVLVANPKVLTAWEDLTPLARNEWICWV
ncbi:MAG: YdeI/OmpD-associated family protein, partial [Candidatus Dormibacteraeota bacterium]|nr:YdeI/OmpD-associated family protein [Candidatus Dormibacteraeota bacterium]